MRKKAIALSLSSILLFGCGTSKPLSDDCCKPKVKTEQEHHEGIMNGLLFSLITYAILSSLKLN